MFDEFLMDPDETLTLQSNNFSDYFQLYNYRILVAKSISHLEGSSLSLFILSTYGTYQRVLTVAVEVARKDARRFVSHVYHAHISSDYKPESVIKFDHELALYNASAAADASPNGKTQFHHEHYNSYYYYALMSSPQNATAFTLLNRKQKGVNIAEVIESDQMNNA
ncbi:unnamed protein product [Anisakis simplex]|uniref:Sema domain-containing protein n=1 Tax=Anisakis simplex TaxID=6269 RepID=A0A0M3K871_ANISI|nr:unnamed protein product [Anisakis simplex]